MALLSDIVRVLHAADVPGYTVHSCVPDLPGDPDLVVRLAGDVDQEAADLLAAARLPIVSLRRVSPGVLHLWVGPQRSPSPGS